MRSPCPLPLLLLTSLILPWNAYAELTITFGGDFALNKKGGKLSAHGASVGGKLISWEELMSGVRPLWDGDLNFANLETVVSDNGRLPMQDKAFQFQTHPAGVEYAATQGLNVFSLANNHTYDFSEQGLLESLQAMNEIQSRTPITCAGAGRDLQEALEVKIIDVDGYRVAFAAIGIATQKGQKAGKGHPGSAVYQDNSHYYPILDALASARADYRILSIHYGTEKQTALNAGQRERFSEAVTRGKADLVLAHHPHVVRPVEKIGNSIVFYSLGNYLILGARNINGESNAEDYGLFGRVHLERDKSGNVVLEALEVIPLQDMHGVARPMEKDTARTRIQTLNSLSQRQLPRSIGAPVLFEFNPDRKSGVFCPRNQVRGERASHLCSP